MPVFKQHNYYKLNINCLEVEVWFLEGIVNALYIPWHSLLIELNDKGVKEFSSYIKTNQLNNTIKYLFEKIEENPKPKLRTECDSDEFQPTVVALGLTDDCDLNCIYCHSDAGSKTCPSNMTSEVAFASLKYAAYYAKLLNRKFEVSFTGPGEPTKLWRVLKNSVSKAYDLEKKYEIDLDLSMATNGYYGNEKREFIVQNFNGVSLSFDGYETIQNLHRPSHIGNGSFDIVFETAKYFYKNWEKGKKKFRFAIRSTVSSESLENLEDIYEFFSLNFPLVKVGFEMLNPQGRGLRCATGAVTVPNQKNFGQKLMALIDNSNEERIINSGAARIGELKTSFCKALTMPSMNVTPEGRIIACQRDGAPDFYEYGYYDHDKGVFVLDKNKIQFFKSLTVSSYDECDECIAKYHCAGDCHDLRRTGFKRCDNNINLVKTYLGNVISEKQKKGGKNAKVSYD